MSKKLISGRRKALLTGGTSGIGRSILPELIKEGFDVYFIGTNESKGEEIELEFNKPSGLRCAFIKLDLSDLHSVREFSQSFVQEVPKLDLLLNIAGIMLPNRQITSDGFEKTFAIDYLAAFILCRELTPALQAAAPSRIVNVGGLKRFILKQRLDFDDLMYEKRYSPLRGILDSVHAKTVLTEILSEKLSTQGVDVNSFDPGSIKGDMARHLKFPRNLLSVITRPLQKSTCLSGNYASTSKEIEGVTGQFFVKTKAFPLSFDQTYKNRLWHATEELLEPIYAGEAG